MRKLFSTWEIDWAKIILCFVILLLSLFTRFVPPLNPTGTTFDEAYFLPQSESYATHSYYFDIHPPLGKILFYWGSRVMAPDIAKRVDPTKVGDGPNSDYVAVSIQGSRLFPRLLGSFVPVFIFLITWEFINWSNKRKKITSNLLASYTSSNYLFPFLAGLMAVFENTFVVDSRFTLMTQILLMFMLGAILFGLKYFKAEITKWRFINLAIAAIFVGLGVSTKWLSLSVVPFIGILILIRELGLFKKLSKIAVAANFYTAIVIMVIIPAAIYFAAFAWHFGHIDKYHGQSNINQEYKDELTGKGNPTSLWSKIISWHQLTIDTQKYIPKIDYNNPGEIGSTWIEWPLMIRPITYNYLSGPDGHMAYICLLGNPIVWLLGLIGILLLTVTCLSELFEYVWTIFERGKLDGILKLKYWLLLFLYLLNWLPFAFINRVMYLYHYFPALVISFISMIVLLNDGILPKLQKLFSKKIHPTYVTIGIFTLILLILLAVFCLFAPITYAWPLSPGYMRYLNWIPAWSLPS